MSSPARIVAVEPLGGYVLRLTFSDGLVRELDFDRSLVGGVFEPLRAPEVFRQVGIDATVGTITWPGGIDLDPDVLHGDHEPASGPAPRTVREFRSRIAG